MLALAGFAAAGLIGWQIGRTHGPTATPLDGLTTSQLGERLMARAGKRFVADNRHGRSIAGGSVTFYDQPLPFGESFCWTTSYTIPIAIVEDRAPAHGEPLEGDVVTRRLYGAWKPPTSSAQPDMARKAACAAYRDFDHMFREANPAAGTRGAYLLDTMIGQARVGHLAFPATCQDARTVNAPSDKPASCDAVALLRRLKLSYLSDAETKATKDTGHSSTFVDELTVATSGAGGREFVVLTIVSEQHYGRQSIDEADIVSLTALVSEWY